MPIKKVRRAKIADAHCKLSNLTTSYHTYTTRISSVYKHTCSHKGEGVDRSAVLRRLVGSACETSAFQKASASTSILVECPGRPSPRFANSRKYLQPGPRSVFCSCISHDAFSQAYEGERSCDAQVLLGRGGLRTKIVTKQSAPS
jgi:hypothetical protein